MQDTHFSMRRIFDSNANNIDFQNESNKFDKKVDDKGIQS